MSRVTFREWSIAMSIPELGIAYLRARRQMNDAIRHVQRAVERERFIRDQSINRISMGEGCTPIFQRIDPNDFYVHPSDTGERQSDDT